MADIRINALATTAASTASDDFIAVDGSANGTRKLNAYSPTFGGNLTVSGTATVNSSSASAINLSSGGIKIVSGNIGSDGSGEIDFNYNNSATGGLYYFGGGTTSKFNVSSAGTGTFAGNLTVSGGTATISHTASAANIVFQATSNPYAEINANSQGGEFSINSGPSAGWGGFLTWKTDTTEKMRLTNTGNLLIGTTSDGGQKLQVSGTAAVLSSGTDQRTFLASNSAGSAEFGVFPNGKGYLATTTADNFEFYTNNTLALTLDSSQNATFAGNIKTAAPSGGTAATWRLGTVASVSPTSPNRTIEVEIGGTTYYIHAKTTND